MQKVIETKKLACKSVEQFMDEFAAATLEGWKRVETMELALAVVTNFWTVTLQREVEEPELEALDVEQEVPTVSTVVKVAKPKAVKNTAK